MGLHEKVIEIFSVNGEIHSSSSFLSKNEVMLLLSKRNEILRSIGFIHGNILLDGDTIEIFEDPTPENIESNTNLIMAVIAPVLYDIITNRSKDFPEFMLAVNASGRMNFLKGLVNLVHGYAGIFEQLDLIINSEELRKQIVELKRFFGEKAKAE